MNTLNFKIVMVGLTLLPSLQTFAEGYPFILPDNMNATINVITAEQERYNNKLLGTNIFGFSNNTEQALINRYQPVTIRFPHGLWANWYDWETDGTRVFGTDSFQWIAADGKTKTKTIDHLAQIKLKDESKSKIGIDGLAVLNSDKVNSQGKGYDMLWTFNMSADGSNFNNGSPVTVARYNDLVSRGFEVKDIELGNENFYPGQRSSIIPNAKEYIKRAKSMSTALKNIDPTIKVSIPLLRRENSANPNWNEDLSADKSYFDAVTIHTYVGSDPDDPASAEGAYATALTARHHLAKSIDDYAGKVAPNKPIWLSEWGVKSGGPNAVSVLGMADAYIFMSENQDRYERANWFSVNGKLNSFLVWETYISPSGVERPRIKYPLQKTAVGAMYEIIRDVLEDSTLLESEMQSPDLMTGVDAISARAVVKDGKTILMVLNLTNKSVPFNVKLNNTDYNGSFNHQAMSFSWMGAEKILPIDSNPLEMVKQGTGTITLPKFSVSHIYLEDADIATNTFSVAMTKPVNNSVFDINQVVTLQAQVNDSDNDIQQVNFRVNGTFYKQANNAPYIVEWTPTKVGSYTFDAVAVKNNNTRKTSAIKTIKVNASKSYVHISKANSTGFALDGGNGGANNQNVKLWTSGTARINQQWEEMSRGADYYSYKKRGTLFCLDAGNGGAKNQNLVLMSCDHQNQNQHFKKISLGGTKFQLVKRNASGFAVDGGTGGVNGQNVKLWTTQTAADGNQIWHFLSID